MGKESFIVYKKWFRYAGKLNDEDFGKLMRSVYAYEEDGAEPEEGSLSPRAEVIFMMAKDDLDRNGEKYADKCKKRKAAAEKRWGNTSNANACTSNANACTSNANACTSNANNANAFFAENENANDADNEYEYEHEYEHDNDTAVAVNNARTRESTAATEKTEVLKTYEKLIGTLTPRVAEIFGGYNMPDELKIRAISEAHDNNVGNIKYIEAILQRYERDGIKSVADAERRSAEYKRRKKGGKGSSPPSNYDFDEIEALELKKRMRG